MKTFTSYQTDIPRVINNTLTDNLTWGTEVINDSNRYLVSKYFLNEKSYTTVTASGIQFYNLPPQVKKIINVTVSIGNVLWQPKECPSREFWDYLNTIQFNQDYPSYFFVYNGQVGIFPTPSSNSNTITMNYKTRIIDMSKADVTGTCTITTNATTVTAAGTPFLNWMAGNWIRVAYSDTNSSNGDNQWYQIASVTSSTVLVLKNAYTGATVTAGSFTIGEVSLLPEDYQDLPLWRLGMIYYSTRFPDKIRFEEYKDLYETGFDALNSEFGSKSTQIILNDTNERIFNPNLYQSNVTQA